MGLPFLIFSREVFLFHEHNYTKNFHGQFYIFKDTFLAIYRLFNDYPPLQLHDNFKPKNMDRLIRAVEFWPKDIPLAIELRNTEWFNDASIANEVYVLFEQNGISNIITDTAGRRDLLHMRLTSPSVFIRYVGANHESDFGRLDVWLKRIKQWSEQGMENLYFFVHQNLEKESPVLSAYFTDKLNKELGLELKIPVGQDQEPLI